MAAKTVLIVDDDADIRLVIRMRLERSQYRISEARNGAEALELIRTCQPDVVLMDWQLPDMSGEELLATLRADPAFDGIRVIIVTGEDAAVKVAVQQGAFSSLLKPFGPGELLDKLKLALG